MTHQYICHFIIRSLKPPPVGAESIWKQYVVLLNSFHSKVKCLIRKFEQIKDLIRRHEVSVLISQTFKRQNTNKRTLLLQHNTL